MEQTNTTQNLKFSELSLAHFIKPIWEKKVMISIITLIFAVASVIIAIMLPNIYKSEALLYPSQADESNNLSSLASKFGGLASLTGVNLGSPSSNKEVLTLKVLQSRKFISHFINKYDLMVPLMASIKWSRESNQLFIDSELYDMETKSWVREVETPFKPKPSAQEAYEKFMTIFGVSHDEETGFISISIKHYSPIIAQQWVTLIIKEINSWMGDIAANDADKSIKHLEKQILETHVSEMQGIFYNLINEQVKNKMLTQVQDEFALKTIDPAIVPELKSEPKRALICIVITLLGFMIGIIFSIFGNRRL